MGDTLICQREGCGHHKSAHRYEWNKFRGGWNTSCTSQHWGVSGHDRCPCGEFLTEEAATTAKFAAAAGPGREHMICPCGHHVDEHYWSASGWTQGVCHVSSNGDYPTCGCREYAGPEQAEPAATKEESTTCG